MHRAKRSAISDLNQHLTCKLCRGYFVDATTIIECLHSFCRSCIVKYLEANKYCPVCDVQVHKTKPLLNIRPDRTLQNIVYKLVPRLFQNELQRRRDFYAAHPEVKSHLEQFSDNHQHILTSDESISITLCYYGCKELTRYLRCPAAVSVGHLQKLVRAKYGLSDHHHVDILHNQDCLNASLTLTDVAYIYSWKRRAPIELTYRIYEYAVKKLKLEEKTTTTTEEEVRNNNNWKEVQLRISENGEMSITGIQDEALELVNNNNNKYKADVVVESNKKELPELKQITKNSTSVANTAAPVVNRTVNETVTISNCVSLGSTSTKTVFSTINSSKCSVSTSSNDIKPEVVVGTTSAPSSTQTETKNANCATTSLPVVKVATSPAQVASKIATPPTTTVVDSNSKGVKRKIETSCGAATNQPAAKQQKQTILNHSIGIHKLSDNHPLKKYGTKVGEGGETTNDDAFSKPVGRSLSLTRPGTPKPCYMPKTVINVPKPGPSTKSEVKPDAPTAKSEVKASAQKSEVKAAMTQKSEVKAAAQPKIDAKPTAPKCEMKPPTVAKSDHPPKPLPTLNAIGGANSAQGGNKAIKSKASTPIGYKTLRDPPKSWNSQIAKVNKQVADPKYGDSKNVRPAKFFKVRNNLPRYLGNPASGVKPMYQVHVSPEKDKGGGGGGGGGQQEGVVKGEIKKHSIVKIDPKTLKPISEKAPETTSLSNATSGADLKINASSVSIFNPLKLQNSPKNERKSPKSPHSPKAKSSASPPNKRDKLNLSFTPPNPFIPNLTSPTVSPNQFLYPTGPPGFPPYDPRVMAAYHSLLYGQRMAFAPGLTLDMNARKGFEMAAPTSPKLGGTMQSHPPPQITQPAPLKLSGTDQLGVQSSSSRLSSPSFKAQTSTTKKLSGGKESSGKNEKSLQNAVEKLTQNRVKEIKNEAAAATTSPPPPTTTPSRNKKETTTTTTETSVKEKTEKTIDVPVAEETKTKKIEDEKVKTVADSDGNDNQKNENNEQKTENGKQENNSKSSSNSEEETKKKKEEVTTKIEEQKNSSSV